MPIYTAGYGNRGFEGFIDLMRFYRVTHLVDVRSVPESSYWEDFRRARLTHLVPSVGLKYVYMGDTLGGVQDSPVLCKDPGSVELAPLFISQAFQFGLDALLKAAADPEKVICLMCGCMKPHRCHRSRLIGEALRQREVSLVHIIERGEERAQETVALEAIGFQESLF